MNQIEISQISGRKNAVIYARVSSVGERQSTERQVYFLTEYANGNNFNIAKIFEEHVSGARRNEERPVLIECLDFCESNRIHTILVSELSRLGRNVDEVLSTVKRCKDSHINIFFQKEGLSLFQTDGSKNPFLHIFISVLATCAEIERTAIQQRLAEGRRRVQELGLKKMGRPEGSCKSKERRAEEYKNVIKELRRGTSIRRTAKLCSVSHSTVERLKKEFNL